ncbi:hypothetical protein GGR51DRAFT_560769 [Nemania sp. FL0031]|nr:hypothetical protein GGR51DRAFT_560769 [Nemania sp. FL0031]
MDDHKGLALALEEAKKGYEEGGIPIGAALVAADGTVLGRGHNMRVQNGNPILHVSSFASSPTCSHFTTNGDSTMILGRDFVPAERRPAAVSRIPRKHNVYDIIAV